MSSYQIADHRITRVDGRDFLFLAEDNAIFEIDSDMKRMLTAAKRQGIDAAMDTGDRELMGTLLSRHLILPSKPPEAPAAPSAPIPLKTLVLTVTDACNLGCLYCYCDMEKQRRNGRDNDRRSGGMTPTMAKEAVDFLIARSGELEEVVLVFFGGEPLLNFPLIRETAAYAKQQAEKSGKRVRFSITTNGTLLTDEIIRFFQEERMSVTVSMDGHPEAHDRYRRFPDGSPSYRIIRPKVGRLLQNRGALPVVARVTLVSNPSEVPRMLDHLLEMGFAEAGFSPVTAPANGAYLDETGMAELLAAFRQLANRFVFHAMVDQFFGFTNLIDLLVTLHEGDLKTHPCGAGLGLFSISPDGRFYLCQRFTNDERFRMGDIRTGLDDRRIQQFRESAALSGKPVCRKCWARKICAGGCYHEALQREGDPVAPNLHYCEWIKAWIETGLTAYCRLSIENPDFLDNLSRSRGRAEMLNPLV